MTMPSYATKVEAKKATHHGSDERDTCTLPRGHSLHIIRALIYLPTQYPQNIKTSPFLKKASNCCNLKTRERKERKKPIQEDEGILDLELVYPRLVSLQKLVFLQ